jgi:chromosome segregation ATPase
MSIDSESMRDRLSELRLEASKKKVAASKEYLRCRSLQKKSAQVSLRVVKYQEELHRIVGRMKYFENKAKEIEERFADNDDLEFAKKEIEHRKRKASELRKKIKTQEKKVEEEKKKIEEYDKEAEECLTKNEELTKSTKALDMEIAQLEIKLGLRKK